MAMDDDARGTVVRPRPFPAIRWTGVNFTELIAWVQQRLPGASCLLDGDDVLLTWRHADVIRGVVRVIVGHWIVRLSLDGYGVHAVPPERFAEIWP